MTDTNAVENGIFDGVIKSVSYIKQEDKALYYIPRAFHDTY